MRLNKNIGKKITKNINRFCDVNILYIVFIVFIVNFLQFIYRKDYESILLVMTITFCVYLFNKNMVFVLLIPLIFVNLLIFMRFVFGKTKESFESPIGDKMITNYDSINKQVIQFWVNKNLKEKDSDDKKGYSNFKKKLKSENDEEYEQSLYDVITAVKNNTIPEDSTQEYDTKPIQDFEEYVTKVLTDAANPNWRGTASKETSYNNKQFNYINEVIIQPLKEDIEALYVIVDEDENGDEDGDGDGDGDGDDDGTNDNEGNENNTADESTSGVSNFKSGIANVNDKKNNKMDLNDLSKGTKDLLADLDVMNPVIERSMKILQDVDVDKLDVLIKKFGNVDTSKLG